MYSDFFISCAYYWSLFLITFVVYVLVFEDSPKNERNKSPNCYYVVKRLLAVPTINKLKRGLKKKQLLTNENVQEQPRKLLGDNETNNQVFFGVDEFENSMYLKIILQKHRQIEVILVLSISGKVYTIPNEEKTLICKAQGQTWQGGGLTLNITEPFNRIRITFKGLLRTSENTEHVELSFLWICTNKAFYYPQDVPTAVLSDALAKKHWRNGDWIKMLGDEKGYEQYGVLQGTVTHGFFKNKLYLQGFRKRYWGSAEHLTQHSDFSLFVVGEDGLALNVGVKSYYNGCDELKYGSFLDNVGEVFPVDQHDVRLEQKIPSNVIFHLTAKKMSYKCVASLLIKKAIVAKGSGHNAWTLNIVPCKFIINAQKGNGFVCFWHASHGTLKLHIEPTSFVSPLSDQIEKDAFLTGEKAKYLAVASSIKSRNFIVPEGFVVLANAFEEYVDNNATLKKAVNGNVIETGQLLADLFLTELIDGNIGTEVMDEVKRISYGDEYTWIVRSSGDGTKFFSECSESGVLKAIASCWGFLHTRGFDECGNTAVLVQKMVPGEISGVLYSHDPFQIVIKPKRHLVLNSNQNITEPQQSLSDDQTSELKKAASSLEKKFGFFCKIRWSFSNNVLHVLQVEPMSDIHKWTDDELFHEFDTPVMTKKEVQTIANVQEIVPGALTPLSASIVKDFFNNYFYQPFGTKLVSLHEQHLVLNVANSIFYQVLNNASVRNLANKRFPKFTLWDKLKLAYNSVEDAFRLDEYVEESRNLLRQKPKKACSALDTFKKIEATLVDLNKIGDYYVRITRNNIAQMLLLSKLAGNKKPLEHCPHLSQLLPFSSNFNLFHELKHAADHIHNFNLHEEFCKKTPSSGYNWLKLTCPEVHVLIETFIKKYGKRGVREFELDSPTWENNVDLIIEELQFQCKPFFSNSKPVVKKSKAQSILNRKLLTFLSKTCRQSLVQKQKLEQFVLEIFDAIREMVKNLSVQMVEECLVTDLKLIYYFSLYELKNLVEHHDMASVPKAVRRKELYPSWDKMRLPTFVHFSNCEELTSAKIKGVFLGDAGNVTGRACVVTTLAELRNLRPGDILITPSVNVKWEPYFSIISGLVTETSGIFACGALNAKERGLPCLVDAQNASLVFKTGDIVLVSQKNSTIELLSEINK